MHGKQTIVLLTVAAMMISTHISTSSRTQDVYPDIPNRALTPGITRTTSLFEILNTPTGGVRHVTSAEKREVYLRYGLDPRHHKSCEVDHLVSLELGGSNDIRNLWPEHYSEPWGARDKDRLEDRLRSMIAHGEITVPQAQHDISTDWIGTYRRVFGNN